MRPIKKEKENYTVVGFNGQPPTHWFCYVCLFVSFVLFLDCRWNKSG